MVVAAKWRIRVQVVACAVGNGATTTPHRWSGARYGPAAGAAAARRAQQSGEQHRDKNSEPLVAHGTCWLYRGRERS